MREIGTMWHIGVLTGKPCTFLVQNGSFSAFWHYKKKERLLMGSDVKWHIPSTCLDSRKKRFSIGIYSINRASKRLWLETPKSTQNGQNVHGFQVRTPICRIVPVSRAYLYISLPSTLWARDTDNDLNDLWVHLMMPLFQLPRAPPDNKSLQKLFPEHCLSNPEGIL